MKKSISGFCGAWVFFLASAAFAGGLSDGLLLHYPFDRDEGPVLTDASGSGRFGWAHETTWVADGATGGGCRFESNRQYVVADDAGLPRGDAPRTMALWIKLDKLAPDPVTALLTYGQGSWNHMSGIGMDWREGRANLYFSQHGGGAVSEWRMEKPGVWHHLAYVYEGKGQHRFYVDGRPGNGMSELWEPLDTQLSGAVIVGADPTGTGPVGGVLDDVRIYGRALSEKEIAELAKPAEEGEGGLLVHYTFDQDEGGIVTDASGNGRTAKVDGATWVKDGARGGAYRFENYSQSIAATDAGLPEGNSPRTMALWMKIDNVQTDRCSSMCIYGTKAHDQFCSLGFDWRGGRNHFSYTQWGATFLTADRLSAPGTWMHVAYTYAGNGEHHLFFNGKPSDGMNELWGPVNTALSGLLKLGTENLDLGPTYVDDVRIYGRALSAAEIAELAVGSSGESDPREGSGNSETNLNEDIEFQMIGSGDGAAGALTIQWACEPGRAYDLYWTDDLTQGFMLIAAGLVSDGTEISYTNAVAGERIGFYRVALHK